MYLAGIISEDGVIDGAIAAMLAAHRRERPHILLRPHDGDPLMTVTQNDIRAIQLAKAALYAGIKLLMDKLASIVSTDPPSPAPSAPSSTRNTPWCWA
jgi:uncharacterized 2Fe-2S/4Fe-4S cluster protein (DUF4445 family)